VSEPSGEDDRARIRQRFAVVDEPVVALDGAELDATTAQERYRAWRRSQQGQPGTIEYLLPRVTRAVDRAAPAFRPPRSVDPDEVERAVEQLGPWRIPFDVGGGRVTMPDSIERAVTESRILYRRDLIVGTLVELLGDDLIETTFLDIGCNSGFFSLELAALGAERVDGIDLRPENIAQARYLAGHYGLDNATFEVADVDAMGRGDRWDVVLNLGVLYHVVQPLQLLRQTYEQCRRFAIVDTVCHREPVSAFFLLGDKDVARPTEGRDEYELHPTYRAVIDGLRFAGFSEVIELVGEADPPHDLYEAGNRRCFLAVR
jgi:2-polyprenyl-3-methyl-5-hydroxy-6-metoxy-1,4-benzoquinol methylase